MPYKDKEQQREAARRWARSNRTKNNDLRTKYRKRNQIIANAFKDVPCADCGKQYPPCVMDFDHADSIKVDGVAKMIHKAVPIEKLVEEILKCDVVCANCHRIRTHKEKADFLAAVV